MKLKNYTGAHLQGLGELILAGLENLENPYVLFDDSGRVKFANSQFFDLFGKEAAGANVFVLLNNTLGIQNISKSFAKDGVESLCVGIMHLDGQKPVIFRVLGSKIIHNKKIHFQCVISRIRPMMALQLGVRECEFRDVEKLAKFIGAIAVEVDPQETGAHLIRTSRHLGCLCASMRDEGILDASDKDIKLAVACSIMHDVGKIYVSPGILHKADSLTEMEWGIIKGHVTAGISIAETLKLPKVATDIIAFHHCRWDGLQDRWDGARQARDSARGGYPFCAKGEDIPIWARAFAYVDIFDALITHRSYKPAWSIRKAAGYMRDSMVGTHLDPRMFPSFVKSLTRMVRR